MSRARNAIDIPLSYEDRQALLCALLDAVEYAEGAIPTQCEEEDWGITADHFCDIFNGVQSFQDAQSIPTDSLDRDYLCDALFYAIQLAKEEDRPGDYTRYTTLLDKLESLGH